MGFWNSVIYISTSRAACKTLFYDIGSCFACFKQRKKQPAVWQGRADDRVLLANRGENKTVPSRASHSPSSDSEDGIANAVWEKESVWVMNIRSHNVCNFDNPEWTSDSNFVSATCSIKPAQLQPFYRSHSRAVDHFTLQLLGSRPWYTYFPHKLHNIYRDSGGVLASQHSVASLKHYVCPTIRRTVFATTDTTLELQLDLALHAIFLFISCPVRWTLWMGSRWSVDPEILLRTAHFPFFLSFLRYPASPYACVIVVFLFFFSALLLNSSSLYCT